MIVYRVAHNPCANLIGGIHLVPDRWSSSFFGPPPPSRFLPLTAGESEKQFFSHLRGSSSLFRTPPPNNTYRLPPPPPPSEIYQTNTLHCRFHIGTPLLPTQHMSSTHPLLQHHLHVSSTLPIPSHLLHVTSSTSLTTFPTRHLPLILPKPVTASSYS
jgi:hypothetical protein